MEKIIDIDSVSRLKDSSSDFSRMGESYTFCHIKPGSGNKIQIDTEPMKMSGTMMILLRAGAPIDVEINLQTYRLEPDSLMYIFPGNVVKLLQDAPADIEAFTLFFDAKFLQNVNLNMSAIAIPPMMTRPSPIMQLSRDEADVLIHYFELLRINSLESGNPQICKNIATTLIASVFYQIVLFHHRRLSDYFDKDTPARPLGRRHDYVRDFVRLVHVHHVRERSVAFYADKLFISSKYLTLLVKKATGRSAAKWIDDFVIMEAKNLLRFSGKNIQQVAYTLNFPTQSSFGKYFKHLTGMSPTEFQKS